MICGIAALLFFDNSAHFPSKFPYTLYNILTFIIDPFPLLFVLIYYVILSALYYLFINFLW